jgi:hypothetical protein
MLRHLHKSASWIALASSPSYRCFFPQSFYYKDFQHSSAPDGESPKRLACHWQRRPRRSRPNDMPTPTAPTTNVGSPGRCGVDGDAGDLHLLQRTGPTAEPQRGDLKAEALDSAETPARDGRTRAGLASSRSLDCYSPIACTCACDSTLGAPRFNFAQIN